MSERIRSSYDDALYKSTYTLLYSTLPVADAHVPCASVFWDSLFGLLSPFFVGIPPVRLQFLFRSSLGSFLVWSQEELYINVSIYLLDWSEPVAVACQLVGARRPSRSRPDHDDRRRRGRGVVVVGGAQSGQTGGRVGPAGDGRGRTHGEQEAVRDGHGDDDVVQSTSGHGNRVDAEDLVADPQQTVQLGDTAGSQPRDEHAVRPLATVTFTVPVRAILVRTGGDNALTHFGPEFCNEDSG